MDETEKISHITKVRLTRHWCWLASINASLLTTANIRFDSKTVIVKEEVARAVWRAHFNLAAGSICG